MNVCTYTMCNMYMIQVHVCVIVYMCVYMCVYCMQCGITGSEAKCMTSVQVCLFVVECLDCAYMCYYCIKQAVGI